MLHICSISRWFVQKIHIHANHNLFGLRIQWLMTCVTSTSANPRQMQWFPWFWILIIIATWLAKINISLNLGIVSKILVLPFPKNWWYGIIAPCQDNRLFWNTFGCWAASAQSWFLSDDVNFPPFNIALTQLYNAANFCSSLHFVEEFQEQCIPRTLQTLHICMSSPMQCPQHYHSKCLTLQLYFESNSFICLFTKSLFCFKK